MREYLMTLISVALLGGIVGMLSPEGDLQKYVRLLGALCLLCAMIGPVISLWQRGDLFENDFWKELIGETDINYDEIYNQTLIGGSERVAEESIKISILKEFSLAEDSIDVSVDSALENTMESLPCVTVILRDAAIFADPREVMAHVSSLLECRCIILYE